jgi:predicted nucleotide-binding protein
MPRKRKIFISYKRNTEPDEMVALAIFKELSKGHEVFIDQVISIGKNWGQVIEKQLHSSNFLICLVSEESIKSEMVVEEIATAYRLSKQRKKNMILPVRLNYTKELKYPLSAYLNSIIGISGRAKMIPKI